jgi:hypothetical protein
MRETVLPEDKTKISDETLEKRLEDTNQQLKRWMNQWRPVIDHSMKRVKELAKENSKPIWQHFTANKPTKQRSRGKYQIGNILVKHKKMYDNPLKNV